MADHPPHDLSLPLPYRAEVADMGAYAVTLPGWAPLHAAVTDPAMALSFSPERYPQFDGLIARQLMQPLPQSLQGSLAALRNFLFQHFYHEPAEGMTHEQARHTLEDIAYHLAEGLQRAAQPVQVSDPTQPQVDWARASTDGAPGPAYLYATLAATSRQHDWLRPFGSISSLFGGRELADWQLLPLAATPFASFDAEAMRSLALGEEPTAEEIDAVEERLVSLETQAVAHQQALGDVAVIHDLNLLGDQLLHTAEGMQDISQISEPVRQEAVDIAREILRKLKIGFGSLNVLAGLGIGGDEDVAEMGGVKGVVKVYERLLAWGRGIDASIMQYPTILAATHAIGQLGYALKLEALRLAKLTQNTDHVRQLEQQMGSVPSHYQDFEEESLAALLYRIEQGIDAVLNRVQEINGPGAMVGHSPMKELGSYMQNTPIAGMALQASEAVTNRHAASKRQQNAMQEGMAQAQRAQLQRLAQQLAGQQRSGGTPAATPATRSGGMGAQIAIIRQRIAQARRNVANITTVNTARLSAMRAGQQAALHGPEHDHGHDHGDHPTDPIAATMAKIDPRLINNIRAMATSTAGLTTNPVLTGRAAFDKIKQANTYGVKQGPKKDGAPTGDDEKKKQEQPDLHKPQPPHKGGGRGF